MTNANQVQLEQVYARNGGGATSEESIKDNVPYELVMEAEAGSAMFNAGGAYKLIMVLRDLTTSSTVSVNTVSGSFGDANWPAPALKRAFPQAAAGAGRDDHVLQALAVLSAGVHDPSVESEESEVFIITQP